MYNIITGCMGSVELAKWRGLNGNRNVMSSHNARALPSLSTWENEVRLLLTQGSKRFSCISDSVEMMVCIESRMLVLLRISQTVDSLSHRWNGFCVGLLISRSFVSSVLNGRFNEKESEEVAVFLLKLYRTLNRGKHLF